jgi:hypothetical protein
LQDNHVIGPDRLQQVGPFGNGRQRRLESFRVQDGEGVRVERDRDDGGVATGQFPRRCDQGRVTAMHPVKVPDGHDPAAHIFRRGVVEPQRDDGHAGSELVPGRWCPSL